MDMLARIELQERLDSLLGSTNSLLASVENKGKGALDLMSKIGYQTKISENLTEANDILQKLGTGVASQTSKFGKDAEDFSELIKTVEANSEVFNPALEMYRRGSFDESWEILRQGLGSEVPPELTKEAWIKLAGLIGLRKGEEKREKLKPTPMLEKLIEGKFEPTEFPNVARNALDELTALGLEEKAVTERMRPPVLSYIKAKTPEIAEAVLSGAIEQGASYNDVTRYKEILENAENFEDVAGVLAECGDMLEAKMKDEKAKKKLEEEADAGDEEDEEDEKEETFEPDPNQMSFEV